MKKTGLCSITFRDKSIGQIINIVKEAGLERIEWGSDVHCKPTDTQSIDLIVQDCKKNDIIINSYGSYISLGDGFSMKDFSDVLLTAKLLDTNLIRIWAGKKGSAELTDSEYQQLIAQAQEIARVSAEFDSEMIIAFEYHGNTVTDNAVCAKKFIEDINRENIKLYWQPNYAISHEENIEAIKLVYDYIVCVHIFSWTSTAQRLLLADRIDEVKCYYDMLKNKDIPFLLEFTKDNDEKNLIIDAKTLAKLN